ncbi:MAG TPA: AraC family transcriptional regulator [Balneolaceae bacterium]|nr:AraC family transcriptional regulator [Balneolaceae bacterium]
MTKSKSIYFRIPKIDKEGFVVQYDDLDHFYNQLHHHPELQLIYIIEGAGDLFVGNSITPFEAGNLFLIGSNQSHIFKSDPEYFQEDTNKNARSISIFFNMESLGDGFFDITETIAIRNLINRAARSIEFHSETAQKFGDRMEQLINITGFDRFLEILSLLNDLAKSNNYDYLTAMSNSSPPSDKESERINNVINYILNHYKEDIPLQTIAEVANYSKAAFCRFFKKRTRKTFSEFLNEVRISQACKLLRNSDLNISQICYESGYNNVSNFNRQFKKLTGTTPKSYSKKYKKLATTPHAIGYSE